MCAGIRFMRKYSLSTLQRIVRTFPNELSDIRH
jgi:hypothetical protein